MSPTLARWFLVLVYAILLTINGYVLLKAVR